jgi:phosphoribosylpyrophosphate synthetase
MEKSRSAGVVRGEVLAGDVRDATAIIVDDLISTGGTLVRAARACRAGGAKRIVAAAAHGLFMGGARELMAEETLSGIVVANTVSASRRNTFAESRRSTPATRSPTPSPPATGQADETGGEGTARGLLDLHQGRGVPVR